MAALSVEHTYQYRQHSSLGVTPSGPRLHLSTTEAPAEGGLFFQGNLLAPRRTAELLLTLADVVQSRVHVPPAMLERILREADPVVTCAPTTLRCEAFSSCCSVYSRIDFAPHAFEGETMGVGTTNVDFNPGLRTGLSRVRDHEKVRITVGQQELALERTTERGVERVIEKKVTLPLRWLKGFTEVQALQSRMSLRLEANGLGAQRFLRAIPRSTGGAGAWWVAPLPGGGLRLGGVPTPEAVRVGGVQRLRLLEPLARYAVGMNVYSSDDGQVSGWEVLLPEARFHLVLSEETWRGFSGEGQALADLARPLDRAALAKLRAALSWQQEIRPESLAESQHLPPGVAAAGLAQLAASGLVGYDLGTGAYFHRVLPFDLSAVERLQPRLKAARELVGKSGVRLDPDDATVAWVDGSGVAHRVRLLPEGPRCSCPWFSRHAGKRGPCKHILAARLAMGVHDDA